MFLKYFSQGRPATFSFNLLCFRTKHERDGQHRLRGATLSFLTGLLKRQKSEFKLEIFLCSKRYLYNCNWSSGIDIPIRTVWVWFDQISFAVAFGKRAAWHHPFSSHTHFKQRKRVETNTQMEKSRLKHNWNHSVFNRFFFLAHLEFAVP